VAATTRVSVCLLQPTAEAGCKNQNR
jgi:hypothetical protein